MVVVTCVVVVVVSFGVVVVTVVDSVVVGSGVVVSVLVVVTAVVVTEYGKLSANQGNIRHILEKLSLEAIDFPVQISKHIQINFCAFGFRNLLTFATFIVCFYNTDLEISV